MAEGMAKNLLPGWEVFSAGSTPGVVHPLAISTMKEIGIDISQQRSKNMNDFLEKRFDYVVTLCQQADAACPYFPNARSRLHRSFADPTKEKESLEKQLAAFRKTRDQIKAWLVEELIPTSKNPENTDIDNQGK